MNGLEELPMLSICLWMFFCVLHASSLWDARTCALKNSFDKLLFVLRTSFAPGTIEHSLFRLLKACFMLMQIIKPICSLNRTHNYLQTTAFFLHSYTRWGQTPPPPFHKPHALSPQWHRGWFSLTQGSVKAFRDQIWMCLWDTFSISWCSGMVWPPLGSTLPH